MDKGISVIIETLKKYGYKEADITNVKKTDWGLINWQEFREGWEKSIFDLNEHWELPDIFIILSDGCWLEWKKESSEGRWILMKDPKFSETKG